ncbi:MAG: PD40 domain-containing protein [Bryobacterales bacterium]|nr:PD40 domain-containing protein [Bryobacterales bacterium]
MARTLAFLTLSLLLVPACLAQQPTAEDMPQEMIWVDRAGRILGRVGAVQNSIFHPEISPDGKSIAVTARDGEVNDRDIWIHDVATGAKRFFAGTKGNDNFPIWSPGGKQIIFNSSRSGNYELYRKDLGSDQPETLLYAAPGAQYPRSWSPDGRWLLFTQADRKRDVMLWEIGKGEPIDLYGYQNAWTEVARFSPNGRFIVYVSNVEGPFEVYVSPAGEPRKRWKVSRPLSMGWAGGGGQARWRADGRELFYVMGNDTMLSVEVNTEGEFTYGEAKRLFSLPGMKGNFPDESPATHRYDVTADGQRFLFVRKAAR